ncbi:MAG: hypothetical protein WEA99_05120 [Brumimicrobium sp.]
MWSKKELKKIRELLPRHKYDLINEQLRYQGFKTYSKSTIDQTLKGKHQDLIVLLTACEVIRREKFLKKE